MSRPLQSSGIQGELDALGVSLAFIGSGNPAEAKDFAEAFGVKAPLYVDPGRRVYEVLGLAHGVGRPSTGTRSPTGCAPSRPGYRQGAVEGDPWQQGGVFLVMPDGSMPYAYRSASAGDDPEPGAIVSAAKAAVLAPNDHRHSPGPARSWGRPLCRRVGDSRQSGLASWPSSAIADPPEGCRPHGQAGLGWGEWRYKKAPA